MWQVRRLRVVTGLALKPPVACMLIHLDAFTCHQPACTMCAGVHIALLCLIAVLQILVPSAWPKSPRWTGRH